MINVKTTDQCLTYSYYFFLILAVFAVGNELYEKIIDFDRDIDLTYFIIFMIFAFFSKYQYIIQYCLKKFDLLNTEERCRQLRSIKIEKKR